MKHEETKCATTNYTHVQHKFPRNSVDMMRPMHTHGEKHFVRKVISHIYSMPITYRSLHYQTISIKIGLPYYYNEKMF